MTDMREPAPGSLVGVVSTGIVLGAIAFALIQRGGTPA